MRFTDNIVVIIECTITKQKLMLQESTDNVFKRKETLPSLKVHEHNQGSNNSNAGKTITEEISKTGGVSFAV